MGDYYINIDTLKNKQIAAGVRIKVASGERLMVSFVEISEGADIPFHCHSNEQAGIVLEGEIEFTIGTETRILKPGQSYLIPANVLHGGKSTSKAQVLDVFSPPREDYL